MFCYEQELQKDVEDHVPPYEELNKTAAAISEICIEDVGGVEDEIQGVNKRWDELKKNLPETYSKVDDLQNQLQQYRDALSGVDDKITEIEKDADDDRPPVSDIDEVKAHVDELKALRDKLDELKPDVDSTIASGQDLLDKNPDVDTSAVQQENEALPEHYDAVKNKVDEKLEKTERLLAELDEYWDKEKELEKEIKDVGEGLEQNKPREMDLEKIKEQLENTKVLWAHFIK